MAIRRSHTLRRAAAAWIALCAIVFAAVAPSVSRALAASGDAMWVEVCTSDGLKRVALDAGSSKTPPAAHAGADCPFCRLQAHVPVIPAPDYTLLFLNPDRPVAIPRLTEASCRSAIARGLALSRAPPSCS
jgi:hypothetical protein